MGCTIKEYLQYMKTRDYAHLFDPQCLRDLENVEQVYGETVASESIMEVVLSEEELGGDYSFCVKTEEDLVTEFWVELDAGSYRHKQMRPCYFIGASSVAVGKDNERFYERALVRLVTDCAREKVNILTYHRDTHGDHGFGDLFYAYIIEEYFALPRALSSPN